MAAFTVCTNDAFLAGGHAVVRADKTDGIVQAKMTQAAGLARGTLDRRRIQDWPSSATAGSSVATSVANAPGTPPQAKDPAPLAWQTEGRGLDGPSISPRKSNPHVPRSRACPLNFSSFVREDQRSPMGPSTTRVLLARTSRMYFSHAFQGSAALSPRPCAKFRSTAYHSNAVDRFSAAR